MDFMTFKECCEAIVANKEAKALNWAVNYAEAGLGMTDPKEIKVQALYILNNMTAWRGDLARDVRVSLKKIGGVK